MTFEKIEQFVEQLRPEDKINNPTIDICIRAHEDHLCDPNLKVSNSCIISLTKLVPEFNSRIKRRLDYLIAPVIFHNFNITIYINFVIAKAAHCIADPREKVAQNATQLLNVLRENFSEEDLLNPCLKAIETVKKPRSKIALIDLLTSFIPK